MYSKELTSVQRFNARWSKTMVYEQRKRKTYCQKTKWEKTYALCRNYAGHHRNTTLHKKAKLRMFPQFITLLFFSSRFHFNIEDQNTHFPRHTNIYNIYYIQQKWKQNIKLQKLAVGFSTPFFIRICYNKVRWLLFRLYPIRTPQYILFNSSKGYGIGHAKLTLLVCCPLHHMQNIFSSLDFYPLFMVESSIFWAAKRLPLSLAYFDTNGEWRNSILLCRKIHMLP